MKRLRADNQLVSTLPGAQTAFVLAFTFYLSSYSIANCAVIGKFNELKRKIRHFYGVFGGLKTYPKFGILKYTTVQRRN